MSHSRLVWRAGPTACKDQRKNPDHIAFLVLDVYISDFKTCRSLLGGSLEANGHDGDSARRSGQWGGPVAVGQHIVAFYTLERIIASLLQREGIRSTTVAAAIVATAPCLPLRALRIVCSVRLPTLSLMLEELCHYAWAGEIHCHVLGGDEDLYVSV
jgi:hypothetical protein